jgi:hypothetical protein
MKKLNEYFVKMLAAKKANAPSFTYNMKTYKAKKLDTGMIVYKASK